MNKATYRRSARTARRTDAKNLAIIIAFVMGIGVIVLGIAASAGNQLDTRYCNTVSEQAYDGHPCPAGTVRGK